MVLDSFTIVSIKNKVFSNLCWKPYFCFKKL